MLFTIMTGIVLVLLNFAIEFDTITPGSLLKNPTSVGAIRYNCFSGKSGIDLALHSHILVVWGLIKKLFLDPSIEVRCMSICS